jgi:hypothetical protein
MGSFRSFRSHQTWATPAPTVPAESRPRMSPLEADDHERGEAVPPKTRRRQQAPTAARTRRTYRAVLRQARWRCPCRPRRGTGRHTDDGGGGGRLRTIRSYGSGNRCEQTNPGPTGGISVEPGGVRRGATRVSPDHPAAGQPPSGRRPEPARTTRADSTGLVQHQ